MNIESLAGRRLAFLMVREREDGDDEWVILQTIVRKQGSEYLLDLGPERPAVVFPEGLEEQIREVSPEVSDVFDGAELYIPFVVEDLGSREAHEDLIALGFKWPGEESVS